MNNEIKLWDWYAGQALSNSAICTGKAHDSELIKWFGHGSYGITVMQIATRQAKEYADAMMRLKPNKDD